MGYYRVKKIVKVDNINGFITDSGQHLVMLHNQDETVSIIDKETFDKNFEACGPWADTVPTDVEPTGDGN